MVVECNYTLDHNILKLLGLVWGQCTPSLKEDIIGLDNYGGNPNKNNCLWLFQHLKSSTSGANISQYEYLSYVIYLRSLLKMRQKDNASTDGTLVVVAGW